MEERRSGLKAGTARLVRIRRGVRDAHRTSEFYAWLLDLVPEKQSQGFRFKCSAGEILIDDDASTPIAMEWAAKGLTFSGTDPDGIPVIGSEPTSETAPGSVVLDHVRLNCADINKAVSFYQRLGLALTWSSDQESKSPIETGSWVHLSGAGGYVSLSQADWLPCGSGLPASGPPRFLHLGLAVLDLSAIVARLESAKISYTLSEETLGHRLYLNDPDGIASLGNNLELNCYNV